MDIERTKIKRNVANLGTFGRSLCGLVDLKQAYAASETTLTQTVFNSFAQQAPRPLN